MPVGPYKTFGACTAAMRKKGYSEESADKICGKMQAQSHAKKSVGSFFGGLAGLLGFPDFSDVSNLDANIDVDVEEVEKSLVVRDYDRRMYAVKDKNILDLGYDYENITLEDENHDLVDRYGLMIQRSYADVEFKLLDKDVTTSQAHNEALTIVENNRNDVRYVSVVQGVAKTFASRGVFKTITAFYYMSKSDVKKEDKIIEGEESKKEFMKKFETTSTQTQRTPEGKDVKKDKDKIILDVQIKKADLDKGLVYGVVYAPHDIDTHGDWAAPETIEKAAHDFLPRAMMNLQHEENTDYSQEEVTVVESYIAPCDFSFPSGEAVKKGSWVLVSRVNEESLRKAIASGEITGYSLEGTAVKIELTAA